MRLESISTTRFRSGEACSVAGLYEFAGYDDGTFQPVPQVHEMRVALRIGDTFPAIRSAGKACWWTLVGEQEGMSEGAAAYLGEAAQRSHEAVEAALHEHAKRTSGEPAQERRSRGWDDGPIFSSATPPRRRDAAAPWIKPLRQSADCSALDDGDLDLWNDCGLGLRILAMTRGQATPSRLD